MMSPKEPTELDIPDGVRGAEQAIEVFRAWIADGGLHVVFDPETFRHDASEWGRLLADVTHHIANAIALEGQMPANAALSAIHDAFERGLGEAAQRSGRIKGRTKH